MARAAIRSILRGYQRIRAYGPSSRRLLGNTRPAPAAGVWPAGGGANSAGIRRRGVHGDPANAIGPIPSPAALPMLLLGECSDIDDDTRLANCRHLLDLSRPKLLVATDCLRSIRASDLNQPGADTPVAARRHSWKSARNGSPPRGGWIQWHQ